MLEIKLSQCRAIISSAQEREKSLDSEVEVIQLRQLGPFTLTALCLQVQRLRSDALLASSRETDMAVAVATWEQKYMAAQELAMVTGLSFALNMCWHHLMSTRVLARAGKISVTVLPACCNS